MCGNVAVGRAVRALTRWSVTISRAALRKSFALVEALLHAVGEQLDGVLFEKRFDSPEGTCKSQQLGQALLLASVRSKRERFTARGTCAPLATSSSGSDTSGNLLAAL